MEGQGRPVGLYCQPQSHSLSSRLWIWDLDLGPEFGTWIWDLDLGLDLGLTIISNGVGINISVLFELILYLTFNKKKNSKAKKAVPLQNLTFI